MEQQTPGTHSALDGLSVLVVDDHQDTVDMLVAYLGVLGAAAVGSYTARGGIRLATTQAFEAVVVDLKMRGEDGWWFLRELRALRSGHAGKVPVFAISGDDRQEQAAVLDGFRAFFLKPIELDALVAHLASVRRQRT